MKNKIKLTCWCLVAMMAIIATGGQTIRAEETVHLTPGLAALAADFLVVVGKDAPAVEQQAAETIAAAFRTAGGPANNLLDDETALVDLNRSAFHHLILVGTYSSNVLLRQQWGHWSIDRDAFAREHATSDDALRSSFYEGAPRGGLFVFGAGTFHNLATGLIESGRNDLFPVPAAIDAPKKPGYKISIHITGAGSAGVARAAVAFLTRGLLNGVLPAPDENRPATSDAFLLGPNQFDSALPAWVPTTQLLGWSQPDATEHAGFRQASGQAAQHIWRVKYLPTGTIADFDASPQKRATANELWIAQFISPEAAQAALGG